MPPHDPACSPCGTAVVGGLRGWGTWKQTRARTYYSWQVGRRWLGGCCLPAQSQCVGLSAY
jgi:hypothetical protein